MQTRYSNLPGRREEGRLLRISTVYPQIPESTDDIYLTSVSGDRFDVLAQEFYGNSKYWWVIASNDPTLDPSLFTKQPLHLNSQPDSTSQLNCTFTLCPSLNDKSKSSLA